MNARFAILAVLGSLLLPSGAPAAIPASLYDAGNCIRFDTAPLDYVFCDDGVPAAGGSTANTACATGGATCNAITVPAEYDGDGYTELPLKKTPTTVPGADANGDIALDVDITWPDAPPPAGGYPMLFFMHGCCSGTKKNWESGDKTNAGNLADPGNNGEKWHYNNAWFASRGYVVVNYTSRGFASNGPNGPGRAGSTGQTQIDSRKYEINDFQSLACQIYANQSLWNTATGQTIAINANAVVVTGGSYGGGFAWMALTDPIWTCNADTGAQDQQMRLAAAAPKYGWTDLVYSLVPTGRHSALPNAVPRTDGCDSGSKKPDGTACDNPVPVGVPKQSINAGLYATGLVGANFPTSITQAQTCLTGTYPGETSPGNPTPACSGTFNTLLPEFLADRSAYYQQHWFDNIVANPAYRIPIFSAATLTDPLFPPHEHRRMHNRILSLVPDYPLQAYFGDYQHFVQNKAKEWGDLCLSDPNPGDQNPAATRHVCNNGDFAGNFNADPASLVRLGITTRLNRFIDHYARPAGNAAQGAPTFDVTAALQVCPQKASAAQLADEPGETFVATTFEALSNSFAVFDSAPSLSRLTAGQTGTTTTHSAGGGTHADPVATDRMANKCPTRQANDPAPLGVVQYTSLPLGGDLTMLGAGTVDVSFTHNGDPDSVQLHARLYELLIGSGMAVLADRGFRRLSRAEVAAGAVSFELFGNGWKFAKGNRIRLEIAQDDTPYLKASQPPSGLTLSRVVLRLPVRIATTTGSGTPGGGTPGSGNFGGTGGGALPAALLALMVALVVVRRRRAD